MASQQQPNVELVRGTYEAFNERDLEAVVEKFDEDIEWVEPEAWRYGGTYRGPDAVGGIFERALSDIEDFRLDLDRFIDGGDTVVVVGSFRGAVAETGETIDVPFAHVVDVEDGLVTRFQNYTDTAQLNKAMEA